MSFYDIVVQRNITYFKNFLWSISKFRITKGLNKVFIGNLKHYKFTPQYDVLIFQTLKRFSLLTLGYKINKFSLMSVTFVLKAPIHEEKDVWHCSLKNLWVIFYSNIGDLWTCCQWYSTLHVSFKICWYLETRLKFYIILDNTEEDEKGERAKENE